jgi:hypothetical protein
MPSDVSVTRLAQYRPFERDGLDAEAVLRDLVLAAAVEGDGSITSLRSCQDSCKTLWGLEVELDELRPAFESLVDEDKLSRSNGNYSLTQAATDEIQARLLQSELVETRAFEDWEETLRGLNAGLTDDDVGALRSDLHLWLEQLIRLHGVEAALLLYPDVPRGAALLEEIAADRVDLPERGGRISKIREQALYLFVRQPTEAQRLYLANLLNTAYLMTILTLDPSAAQLVQEITAGQRVYLDTNFIYRVLNLNSPRQYISAKRLLELTKSLGYETVVTPWTVNELKESLERARTFLMSRPIPPAELADLAASATTDENFVTAYWRRLKTNPVSPKDFYEFYAQIEDHLQELGITVVADGTPAVDRSDEAINDQLSIIERVLGDGYRHDAVKIHDVKHRLLVERLRGGSHRAFSTAGFWFLTCDSLLPAYDRAASEGTNSLPFCVSSSAWAQVVRSFIPRTEDFDQTLTDLLASPFVRYRGPVSYQTVEQVLGRVAMYEGRTPELAAKVLLDTALLRKVADTPAEEERLELIHDAIVERAADVQAQLDEATAREAAEREARRLAEDEARASIAKAGEAEDRAAVAEAATEAERKEREALRAQADAEQAKKDARIEKLEESMESQRKRLQAFESRADRSRIWKKRGGAALIGVAGAAVVAIPIAFGWVADPWPVTLTICAGLGFAFVVAGLLLGWRRAWIALVGFGVLIAIVLAVHELVTDSKEPKEAPPISDTTPPS